MFLELVSKNDFDSVNNIKIIIHSSIKLEFLMHNIIINCWLTRSKVQPTGQNNTKETGSKKLLIDILWQLNRFAHTISKTNAVEILKLSNCTYFYNVINIL